MTRFANQIICVAGAIAIATGAAAPVSAADKPADQKNSDAAAPIVVKPVLAKPDVAKPQPAKTEPIKTVPAKTATKVRVNTVVLSTPEKEGTAKKSRNATGLEESLHERARGGDPHAQYFMGRKYHYGKGVKENRQTAFGWFKMAARGRVAAAHYVIGLIRLTGEIGAPDIVEAYARFRIAAKGGDVRAAAMIFYVGPRMNGMELRKSDVRYRALLRTADTKIEAKAGADKK